MRVLRSQKECSSSCLDFIEPLNGFEKHRETEQARSQVKEY